MKKCWIIIPNNKKAFEAYRKWLEEDQELQQKEKKDKAVKKDPTQKNGKQDVLIGEE